MALLELRDVHTYYANIPALARVSLAIDQGEIVTLIGSNGAGKSTTLKTISGLLRPRAGEIWFDGKRLDGAAPPEGGGRGGWAAAARDACPRGRGPRHLAGARGTPDLPAHDRPREPRDGRIPAREGQRAGC